MPLSDNTIENCVSKKNIWDYITALQQVQKALYGLEKVEDDPEILQDFSNRALEIGVELENIIKLIQDLDKD